MRLLSRSGRLALRIRQLGGVVEFVAGFALRDRFHGRNLGVGVRLRGNKQKRGNGSARRGVRAQAWSDRPRAGRPKRAKPARADGRASLVPDERSCCGWPRRGGTNNFYRNSVILLLYSQLRLALVSTTTRRPSFGHRPHLRFCSKSRPRTRLPRLPTFRSLFPARDRSILNRSVDCPTRSALNTGQAQLASQRQPASLFFRTSSFLSVMAPMCGLGCVLVGLAWMSTGALGSSSPSSITPRGRQLRARHTHPAGHVKLAKVKRQALASLAPSSSSAVAIVETSAAAAVAATTSSAAPSSTTSQPAVVAQTTTTTTTTEGEYFFHTLNASREGRSLGWGTK